MSEDKEGKTIK